jgi:hypothetical protein
LSGLLATAAGAKLCAEVRLHARLNLLAMILALCLAPAMICAGESAHDQERRLAQELVAAMKIEEQFLQKVEARILARCHVDGCDQDLRQCLLKPPDLEYLRSRLETIATREFSPEDLREGIAYFRTETGLKHLDILRAEQGLGGSETLFNQEARTRAGILAFLDTRVGYLLITRSVLTSEASSGVDREARSAFWRCKPEK